MAYGQLLNQPNGGSIVQYAAGVFNASRNGYYPLQDGRHVAAYLNFHPFGDFEGSIVENLNFGGSVLAGANAQTIATPPVLRTLQAISGNAVAGIPFLALNNNVGLYGPVAFWDMHAAWFYQQLAVIAEWQSGYQDYALNTSSATRTQHTNVPVGSYYVTAGYMLTGETRSQLGIVKPLRPFSLRTGQFGPGAWELFGRYNSMDVSDNIFTGGLAERFGNANRLWQTDVGLTWHMTQYIKCFFEWNHVEYNNPVTYAISPSGSPKVAPTNNILWARLQLFF
jgi:phosphate-selective porin OprO/OprP